MSPTVRSRFVRRSTGVACDSGRHRYEIIHCETGRVAGWVAPWAADFVLHGCRTWNAYTASPWADKSAINNDDRCLEDAILAVLDPDNARPPDHWGKHENDMRFDEARSRAAFPDAWEFYDWLVSVTRENGTP